MINPVSLKLDALPSFSLERVDTLPSQPGIYFVIDSSDAIQYIGQSKNVRNRFHGHHRLADFKAMSDVKVVYLSIGAIELLPSIEEALISWFKPPMNFYVEDRTDFEGQETGRLRKQPKARANVYGEKKTEKIQLLFTKTAVDTMDARATQLKLSRSEYIERAVRWLEEHWDTQLDREIGG